MWVKVRCSNKSVLHVTRFTMCVLYSNGIVDPFSQMFHLFPVCVPIVRTHTNTRIQTHTATAIDATLNEADTQSWVLSCHFKSLFLTRLNYVCIFTCTTNAFILRIHMYLSENYQKPLFSHLLENFRIMAVWIRTHTRTLVSVSEK